MKLRSIQVLRAVAAIAVVVHHSTDAITLTGPGRYGAFGVDLFFVISGFIMATVAADQQPMKFLSDRASRILPMWWIALVPWLVIRWPGSSEALASALLWPVYANVWHPPVLGVGWTLGFEALFYFAFATALATRAAIPLLAFTVFAIAGLIDRSNALFGYLGSGLIVEFLLGVAVAKLPKVESLALPCVALALACACFASPHYSSAVSGPDSWIRAVEWGIPAALVVFAAVSAERWFALPAFSAAVFLGDASYSIYLFHPLAAQHGHWLAGTAMSIALGVGAYLLLERRILRSHKRHAPAIGRRRRGIKPGDRFDQGRIGTSWRV